MHKYVRLVAIVAVLALVVAACGDDDSAENGGNADAGNNNGGNGSDNSLETFGPDDTLPTTVGDVPGLSSECEALANLSLAFSSALTGGFDGVPSGLVDDLPSEFRAEGEAIAEALEEYSRRLEEAGIDISQGIFTLSEEQIEVYSDIADELFDDELEDSFERLATDMADDCLRGR